MAITTHASIRCMIHLWNQHLLCSTDLNHRFYDKENVLDHVHRVPYNQFYAEHQASTTPFLGTELVKRTRRQFSVSIHREEDCYIICKVKCEVKFTVLGVLFGSRMASMEQSSLTAAAADPRLRSPRARRSPRPQGLRHLVHPLGLSFLRGEGKGLTTFGLKILST